MNRLSVSEYADDLFAHPSQWPGHRGVKCPVFYYTGMAIPGGVDIEEPEVQHTRVKWKDKNWQAIYDAKKVWRAASYSAIASELGVLSIWVSDRMLGRTKTKSTEVHRIIDAIKAAHNKRMREWRKDNK